MGGAEEQERTLLSHVHSEVWQLGLPHQVAVLCPSIAREWETLVARDGGERERESERE